MAPHRMNTREQMEFPSLAFPDHRKILYPFEVSARLRCSIDHIFDLIAEGKMKAINLAGGNNLTDRRHLRIPVEAWEDFIKQNTV